MTIYVTIYVTMYMTIYMTTCMTTYMTLYMTIYILHLLHVVINGVLQQFTNGQVPPHMTQELWGEYNV